MYMFLLIIFTAIVGYLLLVKPFRYWKQRSVLQYNFWTAWYETINLICQRRSISDNIQKIYNDFPGKRYCGYYQFFLPSIVLRDPDLIKQILVKDFDHFMNHVRFVPENTEPLWEKNLFSLRGDKWRDMRATLSPSFTSSEMKILFGFIQDCAKQFVLYFEEQEAERTEIEMKDAFTRFCNDVIATAAFGVTCDSLRHRDNEFYLMGKEITNFQGFWKSLKFVILLITPKIAKFFGLKLFDKDISNFFTNLLKENIRLRENEGIMRPDMLNLLIQAKKNREKGNILEEDDSDKQFSINNDFSVTDEKHFKRPINDDDIAAQALIFFVAGFDSVSSLMNFMAYELAVNVDIQQRLQKEIDDTLKALGDSICYEGLTKLKYMDMVITETLRKWPGAAAMDRVCEKPYTIHPTEDEEKPVHFNKGDCIMVPIFGLHRDPNFYPEPDRFNPERFSDENKTSILPYSFLAFGSGPRSCIGNRFALMETKLLVFHLLSKFDIAIVEKTAVPPKLSKSQIQLSVEGGMWLGLKLRKHEQK